MSDGIHDARRDMDMYNNQPALVSDSKQTNVRDRLKSILDVAYSCAGTAHEVKNRIASRPQVSETTEAIEPWTVEDLLDRLEEALSVTKKTLVEIDNHIG